MNVTFYKLTWEKAEPAHLVQGVKGNRRPKGTLYGGNGSYMVAGESSKLYLYVEGEYGEIYHADIYDRVMEETGRKRMSDNLYNKLLKKFKHASFIVHDDGYIEWDCCLL